MIKILNELEEIQKVLQNKALNKDPSIIMDTLRLDEIIRELKHELKGEDV